MIAQVVQIGAGRQGRRARQLAGQQNLSAPGGGEQPRCATYFQAKVIGLAPAGRAGVQRNPHPKFPDLAPILRCQPPLDFERACERLSAFKNGEEAIAHVLDDLPAMPGD